MNDINYPRHLDVKWGYFKILLNRVAFDEILSLTNFAILTATVQFALFFWLMYDWPGITNWFAFDRGCEKMRYISENIELNKGTASIMVLSIVPSWVILGIMSSYEAPFPLEGETTRLFTRPLVNFLAVTAYLGSVGVILYDQQINIITKEQERQHDMHVFSAFMLSLSYVIVHLILSLKFNRELRRIGYNCLNSSLLDDMSAWFKFVFVYTIVDIFIFFLYCILFVTVDCSDVKVYLEYILYFGVACCNLAIYSQFVIIHSVAKLDYWARINYNCAPKSDISIVPMPKPQ